MSSRKRTWYTRIANVAVSWTCLTRDTRKPRDYDIDAPWARFVVLTTYTDDDRRLETPMTPAEARLLARRLVMRADFVEDANRQHNDGWTADAVREEA